MGCVAGALVADVYIEKLVTAGFDDVSIESTRIYEAEDVVDLATELSIDSDLAADLDRNEIIADLSGSVMSAFVRGRKPG